MKIGNRMLILFLVAVMIFSVIPNANARQFIDVTPNVGDSFFDAINYMSDNTFMSGSRGYFQPDAHVTRAMVATVLYYFSRVTEYRESNFTDVSRSAWYYNSVSWAAYNNLMYGTSATTFDPDGLITREQLMATLYRYANYRGKPRDTTDRISHCADYNSISNYAIPAMNWAVNSGLLLLSSPSTKIYPKANQDRKWLALCMSRFSQKVIGMEKDDRYGFANAWSNFVTPVYEGMQSGYYMTKADLSRLLTRIQSMYSESETTAMLYRNAIMNMITQPWTGSCHGMTMTALLDKNGMIALNENRASAFNGTTLNGFVPYDVNNKRHLVTYDVISAINYYQVLQVVPPFENAKVGGDRLAEKLREFVADLKRAGIALFSYRCMVAPNKTLDHSVVAYGYSFSGGYHRIKVYDNRDVCVSDEPMKTGTIKISADYSEITYILANGATEIPQYVFYVTDFSPYRQVDLDGDYNLVPPGTKQLENQVATREIVETVATDPLENNYTMLILDANSTVNIQNVEGEYLDFSKGSYTGTMPVLRMGTIESDVPQFKLYVPNSEQIVITQELTDANIWYLRKGAFSVVKGDGIEKMIFYPDNRVDLFGTRMQCEITGAVNTGDCGLARLIGICDGEASVIFNDGNINITSQADEWNFGILNEEECRWEINTAISVPANAEISIGDGADFVIESIDTVIKKVE